MRSEIRLGIFIINLAAVQPRKDKPDKDEKGSIGVR